MRRRRGYFMRGACGEFDELSLRFAAERNQLSAQFVSIYIYWRLLLELYRVYTLQIEIFTTIVFPSFFLLN